MRDLVDYTPHFGLNDALLLKVGRHFRLSPAAKAVVGRNQGENERIEMLAQPDDVLFQVYGWGSPVTLLRGEGGTDAQRLAAAITARYSDALDLAAVSYGTAGCASPQSIYMGPLPDETLRALRI
jgi:hypothetical protein